MCTHSSTLCFQWSLNKCTSNHRGVFLFYFLAHYGYTQLGLHHGLFGAGGRNKIEEGRERGGRKGGIDEGIAGRRCGRSGSKGQTAGEWVGCWGWSSPSHVWRSPAACCFRLNTHEHWTLLLFLMLWFRPLLHPTPPPPTHTCTHTCPCRHNFIAPLSSTQVVKSSWFCEDHDGTTLFGDLHLSVDVKMIYVTVFFLHVLQNMPKERIHMKCRSPHSEMFDILYSAEGLKNIKCF